MTTESKKKNLDYREREKRLADRAAHEREQKIIQKRKAEAKRFAFTEREKFVAGIQATEAIVREVEKNIDGNVDNDLVAARALVMGRRAKLLRSLLGEYDESIEAQKNNAEPAAFAELTTAASALGEQIIKILPSMHPDMARSLATQYGPLQKERTRLQVAIERRRKAGKRHRAVAQEIYRLLELTAIQYCKDTDSFMALLRRGGLKPAPTK